MANYSASISKVTILMLTLLLTSSQEFFFFAKKPNKTDSYECSGLYQLSTELINQSPTYNATALGKILFRNPNGALVIGNLSKLSFMINASKNVNVSFAGFHQSLNRDADVFHSRWSSYFVESVLPARFGAVSCEIRLIPALLDGDCSDCGGFYRVIGNRMINRQPVYHCVDNENGKMIFQNPDNQFVVSNFDYLKDLSQSTASNFMLYYGNCESINRPFNASQAIWQNIQSLSVLQISQEEEDSFTAMKPSVYAYQHINQI